MEYSLLDIIDIFIGIEKKAAGIYETISLQPKADSKLITVSNILIIEEKRHIENYEKLKLEIAEDDEKWIDMAIYNEISSYCFNFDKEFKPLVAYSIPELIRYALDLERLNIGLLTKIQRVLVTYKLSSSFKKCSDVITDLIEIEREHVDNLLAFVR